MHPKFSSGAIATRLSWTETLKNLAWVSDFGADVLWGRGPAATTEEDSDFGFYGLLFERAQALATAAAQQRVAIVAEKACEMGRAWPRLLPGRPPGLRVGSGWGGQTTSRGRKEFCRQFSFFSIFCMFFVLPILWCIVATGFHWGRVHFPFRLLFPPLILCQICVIYHLVFINPLVPNNLAGRRCQRWWFQAG